MKPWVFSSLMLLSSSVMAAEFTVQSGDIEAGKLMSSAQVFNGFGCSGGNQSPQLQWSGVPDGTRSFAVTVHDPDAPTGSGWWHWVVFNIPATTTGLMANAGNLQAGLMPAGAVQSRTDFGAPGYGGPCPPEGHGPHRYRFTVHALKVEKLALVENASAAMVGFMINGNSLGSATLEAIYKR